MINGKIKEWHLDAELLQKLMSGGSDFTEALQEYIKKTDTIDSSQLSEDFLAELENQFQAIRNNIQENYRNNNDAITEEDLDASLQALLETLQQSQGFSGFTREDVENIFNECVSEAMDEYSWLDDIKQDVKNDVLEEIAPTIENTTELINTLAEHVDELQNTVENNKAEADTKYRQQDDMISESDLDPAVLYKIQQNSDDIQELKNSVEEANEKAFTISGSKNQVLIVGDNESIEASDIVTKLNIAVTEPELNSARAELISPIYSFVTPQSVYTIGLDQWNNGSNRISQEETNPVYVPPEPEPVYYTVHYAYTYDVLPDGIDELPQVVLATLPEDETEHIEGDTVIPSSPHDAETPDMTVTSIEVENGIWMFDGWNQDEVIIEDQDVTFTGVWSFEEYVEILTYTVHYQYDSGVSEAVLALLPKDEPGKESGIFVSPAMPYSEYVLDGDLLWHFEGWEPTDAMIEDQDITFIGTWTAETVDPDDPSYQQYKDIVIPEDDNDDDNSSLTPDPSPDPSSNPNNNPDPGNPGTNDEPNTPDDNEPEEPSDDEPPTPSHIALPYDDYTLSAANIKMDGLNVQISDIISGTNNSETDTQSIVIGFYGTRFKLYSSLQEEEQNFRITVDNGSEYNVSLQEKLLFPEETETDHVCCCCIENLSEGLHIIRITVDPGKSLMLDNKISLDDGIHADLLDIVDIPADEFYDQLMFDTGDYTGTLSRQYNFVKSEEIHTISSSDYTVNAFETGATGYERKLLYASNSKKLFYMDENGILIMLSNPYEEKLAELEARIAALEA